MRISNFLGRQTPHIQLLQFKNPRWTPSEICINGIQINICKTSENLDHKQYHTDQFIKC